MKIMTGRHLSLSLLLAGALAVGVAGCDSLEQNPVATSSKDAVFGSENGLSLYATSFYNWMPSADNVTTADNVSDYAARRDVPSSDTVRWSRPLSTTSMASRDTRKRS